MLKELGLVKGMGFLPQAVDFHGSSVPVTVFIEVRLQPLIQMLPQARCSAFFIMLKTNILYTNLFPPL